MKLRVRRYQDGWRISTCSGVDLAVAESVTMSNVDFIDGSAQGFVLAVWGCELKGAAYEVSGAIQALGIGRPFPQPRGDRLDYTSWKDMATGVLVRQAHNLVLHQRCTYYTLKVNQHAHREHNGRRGEYALHCV